MANYPWIGGVAKHIEEAFAETGNDVHQIFYEEKPPFYFSGLKLSQVKYLDRKFHEKEREIFNKKILAACERIRPDIFFVFNEGYVNAATVESIRKNNLTRTVCLIGDDPFDSYRFRELPYSLRYFDQIYVAEKLWIDKIRLVAPNAALFKILSAYDDRQFNSERAKAVMQNGWMHLDCPVSFCGESYNKRAEGGYRSAILSYLVHHGLKLWGDKGWMYQFRFYPELEKAYMGGRLEFEKLVYVYAKSTINLNMTSPQILTSFQPRVFEIAACGGFQIVDHREDLFEVFGEEEIATFKTIPELLDKVDHFLKNPAQRTPYIEAGFKAIKRNTWKERAIQIVNNLS